MDGTCRITTVIYSGYLRHESEVAVLNKYSSVAYLDPAPLGLQVQAQERVSVEAEALKGMRSGAGRRVQRRYSSPDSLKSRL